VRLAVIVVAVASLAAVAAVPALSTRARAVRSRACPVLAPQRRLPQIEDVAGAAWKAAPRALVIPTQGGRADINRRTSTITTISWLGNVGWPGIAPLRRAALAKCPARVVDKSWAVTFQIGTAHALPLGQATMIIVRTKSGWVSYATRI
jgi:hypothetical protein